MIEQQDSMTGVVPHLAIRHGRATEAIDFYVRAFGATERRRQPAEDGRLYHADLALNGGTLLLHDEFPEHVAHLSGSPDGVTLHLQVPDADAVWAAALAAGAIEQMPLADQFWGDRYGQLVDPFGHSWSISGPVRG